eukprot:gb/GFBE01071486.1/.p1 GENE.gb/GFBE01071486.1/~~gb/GFBE01071486.1/.p1  ORF type:complete len:125 (+),score=32.28 gb/GFBE01071486.1/:1-375(+)
MVAIAPRALCCLTLSLLLAPISADKDVSLRGSSSEAAQWPYDDASSGSGSKFEDMMDKYIKETRGHLKADGSTDTAASRAQKDHDSSFSSSHHSSSGSKRGAVVSVKLDSELQVAESKPHHSRP